MTGSEIIRHDITTLLNAGIPLKDIVVNEYDDTWGCTCATTREDAQSLVTEWQRDGCDDVPTVDDLQSAEEWLKDNTESPS